MAAGLALVLSACAAGPPVERGAGSAAHARLDPLAWITGCWQMTTARGTVIDEQWTRTAPDTLSGHSRTQRDGTVVASETMHIVVRADTIVFIAEPSGQQRTEFRATALDHRAASFENAAHDFPQRISYRPAGDSLHARIEGAVGGNARAVDFPMRRAACGTSRSNRH